MSVSEVKIKKSEKNRRAAQKSKKSDVTSAVKKKMKAQRRKNSAQTVQKKNQGRAERGEVKTGARRSGTARVLLRILIFAVVCGMLFAAAVLSVSAAMVSAVSDRIITAQDAEALENVDCVLVLGCGVYEDGTPSPMLYDRVKTGIALFNAGVSDRLLVSGDHGQEDYDEVNAMKRIAVEAGIDRDAVFCDHAGFCTWDSMVRAKEIFGAKRIVVVTQEYHLSRALYMAKKVGLDAWGVSADLRPYGGQIFRDVRELGARFKGFFSALLEVPPKYLGDPIPLSGKGSATDG